MYVIFYLDVIAEILDPVLMRVSLSINFGLKFESVYADLDSPLPIQPDLSPLGYL